LNSSLLKSTAVWLVLALLGFLIFNIFSKQHRGEPEIVFTDFLDAVEHGDVKAVTIQRNNIYGNTRPARCSEPLRQMIPIW